MQVRTDLAMERFAYAPCKQGVWQQETRMNGVEVHDVRIETEEAARTLGKDRGRYVTLCDSSMAQNGCDEEKRQALAGVLSAVLEEVLPARGNVLVVGLGNRHITADALGSRCVEKLLVTRQMALRDIPGGERFRSVCCIAPGVLGITGIETAEIVRGVVDRVQPAAVIAVDALAAGEAGRIGTAIQIADTGISPGSGVGNHQRALTRETLGVPVIAVGVPMVVYAHTIARDAFRLLAQDMGMAQEGLENVLVHWTQQLSGHDLGDMVVTPREVDDLVGRVASVLALGINLALQRHLGTDEVLMLTHDHL